MKFLRRLAHVLSMITLVMLFSRPTTHAQGQRGAPNTQSNQSPPNIVVTVNASNNDGERANPSENTTKENNDAVIAKATVYIAVFTIVLAAATGGLIIVGLRQSKWMRKQSETMIGQLAAATTAATAASTNLRLAFSPHVKFDVKTFGPLGDGKRINLAMNIGCIGTAPARVERVDYQLWIGTTKREDSTAHNGFTIGPGEKELIVITYTVDELDAIAADGRVILLADFAVHFIHPIDGPLWRTYRRFMLVNYPPGSGMPVIVPETSGDWDGRFGKEAPRIPEKYTR